MDFATKRQEKIDRLRRAAARAAQESDSRYGAARKMGDAIPFGQPILVGHHSEGRDRRYRARITSNYEKAFELSDKAKELAARADSAESNTNIFSDDPERFELLEARIAELTAKQELMKAANKLVRKYDSLGMIELGYSQGMIDTLFEKDCMGSLGYAQFQLTNNNANIARLKKRLVVETALAQQKSSEKTINGVRIVDNVEDNRLQLFFPGKPTKAFITELKRSGFRFSPTAGNAWQRYRSNQAMYWGTRLAETFASTSLE